MFIILLIIVALACCGLTYYLRHYALTRSLLDIPNTRSSHTIPTPRGGGLAFVIVFLLAVLVLYGYQIITNNMLWALWGAGGAVAIVGFLDDRGHIAARWRLLTHFVASVWVLYWFSGLPDFNILTITIPTLFTTFLAVFYLVWLLNLYNFMDGIDGIASIEAISVCIGGAIFYIVLDYPIFAITPLVLACTVMGFLFWNFPPAKIFMGDAGSGFLGMIIGTLTIQAAWVSKELFWGWLILLGVFIVDATWTLLYRLFHKQKLYEAHKNHAYQSASRYFNSHLQVVLMVLAINLLWLFPIALLVINQWITGIVGLIISYLPLCLFAYWFKAGSTEN